LAARGKIVASDEMSSWLTKHAVKIASPPMIPVGLSRSPRKAAAVAAAKRGSVLWCGGVGVGMEGLSEMDGWMDR
jgi:hypothetical protein